jgi:death-on-curing protein
VTVYLTLSDVTDLAVVLLALENEELRIRDVGLLQSAIERPAMSVFGADAYPALATKAAALFESLARNYALIDGNKRLAWGATKLFLLHNDVQLLAPSVDDGEAFVFAVIAGELDLTGSAATIARWSTPLPACPTARWSLRSGLCQKPYGL